MFLVNLEVEHGRGGDGENYNDGFVSMCDVPYPEMVEASREVAAELYTRRFGQQ